jgi:hypothetical protein
LRVARTGQAKWGAAALNRLSALSQYTSEKILTFKPPSELSSSNQKRFAQGFKQRSTILKNQQAQSLKACQELGIARGLFPLPVRQCLNEQLMPSPAVEPSTIQARNQKAPASVGTADRAALAQNPNDIPAAVRLGKKLLDAKDPHLARLALAQAIQGGGADIQNLYGIACVKAGDYEGAISGFGRAAVSGLSAGIENAHKLLKSKLNVPNAERLTKKVWNVTTNGGVKW